MLVILHAPVVVLYPHARHPSPDTCHPSPQAEDLLLLLLSPLLSLCANKKCPGKSPGIS
jgi:hypothetical protein